MIRRLVREAIDRFINEIDWEGDFADVSKKCVDTKEIVDYLNQVINNAGKPHSQRTKFGADIPKVHSTSKFFVKGKKAVDLDHFIKEITRTPKSLITQNLKLSKTGNINEFVYNTGIPALRGLAYSIKEDKFYFINTCPGAGKCIQYCYARSGNYVMWPDASDALTRRLNYLLNYPDKFEEQIYNELKAKCEEHNAHIGYRNLVSMRWNDSGDFFTKKYIKIAVNVIKRLRKEGYNIQHYIHTKMASAAKEKGFDVTSYSTDAASKEKSKLNMATQKQSNVIGKEYTDGLNLDKISDIQELKKRLAKGFNIPLKSILTVNELMTKPESKTPKWSVITMPSDGDDAARRKDVLHDFLVQHK